MDELDEVLLCEDLFQAIPLVHDQLVKPFESLFRSGLSPMQFYTLVALQSGGCMAMSELAAHFCIPKQQMTKIVGRLVELEVAERRSDPGDRRLIRVCISEKGRDYLTSRRRAMTEHLKSLLGTLDDGDKRELVRALRSIHRILPKLAAQNRSFFAAAPENPMGETVDISPPFKHILQGKDDERTDLS